MTRPAGTQLLPLAELLTGAQATAQVDASANGPAVRPGTGDAGAIGPVPTPDGRIAR